MENPNKNSKEKISNPELALELQAMVDEDQKMRERTEVEEGYWDEEIDIKNTLRMKEIISKFGFPSISLVGDVGSSNAWLLIQHADLDVDFQKQCLDLMKTLPDGEIDKARIAYLEDRVRVNEGKPQLYGTQFDQKNGKHIPRVIEDEDKINDRRAKMGMGTLDEQIKLMYEKYGIPIEKFTNLRGVDLSGEDLTKFSLEMLLTCDFDSQTKWPMDDKLPAGFDPEKIIEEGKNPGLGIKELHEQGIDGRGITVAIIDQSLSSERTQFDEHIEYGGNVLDYKEHNLPKDESKSMHGPAVLSLLVGKNCGIAPGAKVIYRAIPQLPDSEEKRNFNNWADALLDIVEKNKTLSPSEKIRIVSCSIGYREEYPEPGLDRWLEAIKIAEGSGIVVSDVGPRTGVKYIGGGTALDKENPDNYEFALFLKEKEESLFSDDQMLELIKARDVMGMIKRIKELHPDETAGIADEIIKSKVEDFLNRPGSKLGMIVPSDYRTMASREAPGEYMARTPKLSHQSCII
jgi:hypothetical protein